MAMFTDITNEKKSASYFIGKDRNIVDGIDPELLYINDTDRETMLAKKVPFIRLDGKTKEYESIPIYLDENLKYFQKNHVICDGTFSVVSGLNGYSQIYIFSVTFEYLNNTTYTMPIAMFLMKKKSRGAYIEILELIKSKYEKIHGYALDIRRVSSDAELGFIRAVEFCFPGSQITLCSVHILRCIMKNLKQKVSHKWYK